MRYVIFLVILDALVFANLVSNAHQHIPSEHVLQKRQLVHGISLVFRRSPGNTLSRPKQDVSSMGPDSLLRGARSSAQGASAGVAHFGRGKAWVKSGNVKRYLYTERDGPLSNTLDTWNSVKASAGATDTHKLVQKPIFRQGFKAWASGTKTATSIYLRSGSRASTKTFQPDGTVENFEHRGPGQIDQSFETRRPGRQVNTEIEVLGGGKAKIKSSTPQ